MDHVIAIGPDGSVTSMHNDAFPLGFLGDQDIQRASDIRWDKDEQSWGIHFMVDGVAISPSREYRGFESYEAAQDFEVMVMTECIRHDMSPTEVGILRWAATHRK